VVTFGGAAPTRRSAVAAVALLEPEPAGGGIGERPKGGPPPPAGAGQSPGLPDRRRPQPRPPEHLADRAEPPPNPHDPGPFGVHRRRVASAVVDPLLTDPYEFTI